MARRAWLTALTVSAALLSATAARAEGQVVEVEVGQTVELEVGYARGLRCDDLTIIDAELRDKTSETNAFVVTGKAPGETTCRVGTELHGVRHLFEIHVVPARGRK